MMMMTDGFEIVNRGSPLLESYGCLEYINVTIMVEQINYFDHLEGQFKKLKDSPCVAIYYYSQLSRKTLKWNRQLIFADLLEYYKPIQDTTVQDFLLDTSFHQREKISEYKGTNRTKNILLIYVHTFYNAENKVWKTIDSLETSSSWNVIVICEIFCPVFRNVPIHRLLSGVFADQEIFNRLPGIIRNPDFDAFELERYINKADKLNYTCLAYKRLHLVKDYLSINVLEKTALLSEKTETLNTNITVYYANILRGNESNFWENYIERRNWKNAFTLKLLYRPNNELFANISNNEKDIIYHDSLPTNFCK